MLEQYSSCYCRWGEFVSNMRNSRWNQECVRALSDWTQFLNLRINGASVDSKLFQAQKLQIKSTKSFSFTSNVSPPFFFGGTLTSYFAFGGAGILAPSTTHRAPSNCEDTENPCPIKFSKTRSFPVERSKCFFFFVCHASSVQRWLYEYHG